MIVTHKSSGLSFDVRVCDDYSQLYRRREPKNSVEREAMILGVNELPVKFLRKKKKLYPQSIFMVFSQDRAFQQKKNLVIIKNNLRLKRK